MRSSNEAPRVHHAARRRDGLAARGGGAAGKEAADYRATQMRHNRMESYGINVQHWLPSVIATESRTVLSDLRRAIAAGHARPLLPVVTMVDG